MSISDIQAILGPLAERFFHKDGTMNMQKIYDEAFGMEQEHVQTLKKSIEEDYRIAQETFAGVDSDDREFLQFFSFISLMSYDVYVKKLLVEKMIDGYEERKKEAQENSARQEKGNGTLKDQESADAGGKKGKKHAAESAGTAAGKSENPDRNGRADAQQSAQDEQAKRVKSLLEAQAKEET